MGSQSPQFTERRERTQHLINDLVSERQAMLVRYAGLAGLEPYTDDKPVLQNLQEFCQILIDYLAAGHFGLYDRISRGEERRQHVSELVKILYPRIIATTDVAVEFNDYYDSSSHPLKLDDLPERLSTLGEELANRIELEDKLIANLLR